MPTIWPGRRRPRGHAVRLLPGQAVKPLRGAMKNAAADALAIAEAVRRPGLCPVPIKSEAQLDVPAIHRVRTQLVRERTVALANKLARIAWAVLTRKENYRALAA